MFFSLRFSVFVMFLLNLTDHSFVFSHTYPPNFDREKGLLFDFYPAQKLELPKGAIKKTKYVKDNMDCVFACMGVHWCRSINYKIAPRSNGLHACQLISSEQFAGKKYMGPNKAYNHYSVKNPCQETPCRNDGKCVFEDNRQHNHCVCKKGFEGEQCEKDIDECSRGHSCHANAKCNNTVGSYTCRCKSGHQGDGKSCKDIDECSSGAHSCHANAHCTNDVGSYTCRCNSGYQGDGKSCKDIDECSSGSHSCHANAHCNNNAGSYTCRCKVGYQGDGKRCSDVDECSSANACHVHAQCTNEIGSYKCQCNRGYQGDGRTCAIQAYRDSQGWTLIARFSNNDAGNWMRDDAYWWYTLTTPQGDVYSPSVNQDMISSAFWLMKGNNIKITRSDDPYHTALLQTTSNCLSARTFRSMISSYGTFTYNTVWASDKCLGSCHVSYGGNYQSTNGFSQSHCSSDLQSSNYTGFWCDWSGGDGAVMMIGGGGTKCQRADHGIAITEEEEAAFQEDSNQGECDFGNEATRGGDQCTSSYSLNLWIK